MGKKKYIVPRIECMMILQESNLLAGTEIRDTDGPGFGGTGGTEGGRAKQNLFASWDCWGDNDDCDEWDED